MSWKQPRLGEVWGPLNGPSYRILERDPDDYVTECDLFTIAKLGSNDPPKTVSWDQIKREGWRKKPQPGLPTRLRIKKNPLPLTPKEVQTSRRVLIDEIDEWTLGDDRWHPNWFKAIAKDAGVSVHTMKAEVVRGDRGLRRELGKRLRNQVLNASPAQIEGYVNYRDYLLSRPYSSSAAENPVSGIGIFGLVAAALGIGTGIYLVVKGIQGETQVVQTPNPQPPPLPNYYKGPNGEIITTVGPYGVPPDITNV